MSHISRAQRFNIAISNQKFVENNPNILATIYIPVTINKPHQIATNENKCKIDILLMSSNAALEHYTTRGLYCAVLNFANSRHPGGGYLKGALAQEEELCRTAPALYNSLANSTYPFKWNETIKFTENVEFIRQDGYCNYKMLTTPYYAHVITAAMPNLSGRDIHADILYKNNLAKLSEYIYNVLVTVMLVPPKYTNKQIDVLVLGAIGCGAFSPGDITYHHLIASTFKSIILTHPEINNLFKTICFAIPVASERTIIDNYAVFKETLFPLISVNRDIDTNHSVLANKAAGKKSKILTL